MSSLEVAINSLNNEEIPTDLKIVSLVVIVTTINPEDHSEEVKPSIEAAREGKNNLIQ